MKTTAVIIEGKEEESICPNCGSRIIGKCCGKCGELGACIEDRERSQLPTQSTSSNKQILAEFFRAICSTDSRLLHTVSTLLLRPGQITKDYLAHRRAGYLPPFRTYFLLNLLLYFALGWFAGTSTVSLNLEMDVGESTPKVQSTRELTASLIPLAGFVLLPISALILKLLHLRWRMPFADHFVASLHIKSALALVLCLAALLNVLLGSVRALSGGLIPQTGNLLLLIAALLCFIHIGVSLHRVYNGNWMATVWRCIALLLLYFFFVVVVILLFVLISG